MKRTNTASADMIEEVKELRNRGIKDFYCTYIDKNGKWHKAVEKHTAQGISAYANKTLEAHNFEGKVKVMCFYIKDGVGCFDEYAEYRA